MPKKKKGRNKSIQNNTSEGCISILTPTYNRSHFLKLIIYNIKNQTYDHSKLEWLIYDDGPEPFFTDETLLESKKYLHPIKIKYYYDFIKYRKLVRANISQGFNQGTHTLRISAKDNLNNQKNVSYDFYIK